MLNFKNKYYDLDRKDQVYKKMRQRSLHLVNQKKEPHEPRIRIEPTTDKNYIMRSFCRRSRNSYYKENLQALYSQPRRRDLKILPTKAVNTVIIEESRENSINAGSPLANGSNKKVRTSKSSFRRIASPTADSGKNHKSAHTTALHTRQASLAVN